MSEGSQIAAVFEENCAHVVFDRQRYAAVCQMQEGFVCRNADHIAFFGGGLTGVQRVRFTDSDRDKLFDIILETSEPLLAEQLHNLRDGSDYLIKPNWKIARDPFVLASLWVIHKFDTSKELNPEEREDAKARVCQYLLYRFLTSLMTYYYPYPVNPGLAQATYDALSLKFSLRQYGNWGAMLENLSQKLTARGTTRGRTFESFDVDTMIIQTANDFQGRIRDALKNITSVFVAVKQRGDRIGSVAVLQEIEGEVKLTDRVDRLANYVSYIKQVMGDPNSFIQEELIRVVLNLIRTVSHRTLYQTLTWTSENYRGEHAVVIEAAIDLVMEHVFNYMTIHRDIAHHDIATLLERLSGSYTSPRSTDPRLLQAKEKVEQVMALATGSNNQNLLASARTGWMLYLVTRALTMKYYSKQ